MATETKTVEIESTGDLLKDVEKTRAIPKEVEKRGVEDNHLRSSFRTRNARPSSGRYHGRTNPNTG